MTLEAEPHYQLVLQLRSSAREAFDAMVRLEEPLELLLGDLATVDGHDAGVGEVNVFILTDHPIRVFDKVRVLPEVARLLPNLRVAYRRIGEDEFQVLHPTGPYEFKIA